MPCLSSSLNTVRCQLWDGRCAHTPRQTLLLSGDTLTLNGQTLPASLFWQALRQMHSNSQHGLVGYLGYGASRWTDPAMAFVRPDPHLPDTAWFDFETWEDAASLTEAPATGGFSRLSPWQMSMTEGDYTLAVSQALNAIQAGEIYQANLSFAAEADVQVPDPAALLAALNQQNPSPYAALLTLPDGSVILSNSPERLVTVTPDGVANSRPIAGTRGRGATLEEDTAIGKTLLSNEKERAEHHMLVDLARNDLGRVCQAGSVTVDALLTLERYSHVTHLVSSVSGQLTPGTDAVSVMQVLFPGGTITGCPKIRSMQVIEALEPTPRGVYTGSLGVWGKDGSLDLNILIRTLVLRPMGGIRYNARIQAGAGIVADAVGPHEYRECIRKLGALLGVLP
jgi:para-aminobenzoate synthetase component 1